MKLSQNLHSQAIDTTAKPKTTSFFPLWKLKGNQLVCKTAAVCLVHLEEESAKREEEDKNRGPLCYQWSYRRVYGVPGMGHEGCPSGGEALLPLQHPRALLPRLPAGESLQGE